MRSRMKDRLGSHDHAVDTANDRVRANVKALMDQRRMNQVELAEKLGQSQPWLSKRLTGATPFQIEDLDLIGAFFGLTPAQLLQEGHGALDRRAGHDRRSRMDRRQLGERFDSVRGRKRFTTPRHEDEMSPDDHVDDVTHDKTVL
jgi:transcriptional regulator with XRE-family HTH domain